MLRTRCALIPLLLLVVAGCRKPPEAPEGLEEATRFLLSEFYSDDLTVGAGLTGVMDWYDAEGAALEGLAPDAEEEAANDFRLTVLTEDLLAKVPPSNAGRTLDQALGVMAVSTLSCDWAGVEPGLIRADQDVVFEGEWASYARTYHTDRGTYAGASVADSYPAMNQPLEPLDDGFDRDATAATILMTSNDTGTEEFGVALNYTLHLHLRHGVFDVQGEERHGALVLTYQTEPGIGATGTNALHQTYSIDILIERPDGRMLRLVATWNDIESLLDPESPILVRTQVNRINRFATRMSAICDDPNLLPAE